MRTDVLQSQLVAAIACKADFPEESANTACACLRWSVDDLAAPSHDIDEFVSVLVRERCSVLRDAEQLVSELWSDLIAAARNAPLPGVFDNARAGQLTSICNQIGADQCTAVSVLKFRTMTRAVC